MKTISTMICGMAMLVGLAAFLFTPEASMQNDGFWADAAQGSMTEVMASNVALQKAQNEQVKQFAQQIVTDHTAVGDELKALATTKNVTLPTTVSTKQQEMIDKLNGLSGMDFDREYIKMMVKDHEKTVKLFERESERGTDAEVKAFAAKNLPTLQGHLSTARTLNDSMKNMGRSSGNNSNSSDMNMNSNSSDMNMNANRSNSNSSDDDSGTYSNKRPNVNRDANLNSNSNRSNSNRRTNSNNSNMNSNMNSNVNMR